MRYLITGATGFIGRNLVDRLVAAGEPVHCLVRSSEPDLQCEVSVLENVLEAPQRLAEMNLRFDVVVNLLAAGVDPNQRDPAVLLAANTEFPARLALAASGQGASAFVQVGTSAEYAPVQSGAPMSEIMPLEDSRLYGATKAAGSLAVRAVCGHVALPCAVLRAFNIFGPGEKPHRLFPSLVSRLGTNEPIALSTGEQVRDFLYVADACAAIQRVAEGLGSGKVPGGIYNLATGWGVSVAQFARTIAKIMGADETLLRFGAVPMRPEEIANVVASTDKLKGLIGPVSTRSLETAMRDGITALTAGTNL